MKSINPYTGETIQTFTQFTPSQVSASITKAHEAFFSWKKTSFSERSNLMRSVAKGLREHKDKYAKTMTLEMGKPIAQAKAEIDKCAWLCEYYADTAEQHLTTKIIKTDAAKSYVNYEPIGVVLAVMPWNYPFWQVFRFIVPVLMAGNVGVLKHASNVMGCAELIEAVFINAGFPKHCFQNLPINSSKVEAIIRHKHIKAVTLTGSKPAGSMVASVAGEEIKKSVLELGGSNALVVFKDAEIDNTVATCVQARFQNTGQSCIAGKRLLLHKSIEEEFLDKLKKEVIALKSGNPLEEDTYIGTMAREDLAEELEEQLKASVKEGAKILIGGKRTNAYFEPTIVTNVTPEMSIFKEETFGPVLSVTTFNTDEETVDLVNQSDFGLGVSIFTENDSKIEKLIPLFEDGAVFVNELVKSDPRLPFGGTKISGYGRELSEDGIKEFVNKKTVYIK
ncbi:NAD-dependent succinate-semialdehyde dehydrogenase [Croceibacter atlanticus]|uniref:NAD-dependent succinate-semialdehyde dehydrogenase n=1 Tax=Croceibacter atlanticus TaxID=313588 RepID=UPI001C5D8BBB|nr:NAD-dependent succinate-semialdehyde dehydrogenase [Croceibacter atlanticus]MBW4969114.1 NAD-dependent succinate-semialdehyde dehydrogenase [Croceibacter atlanticus]